MAKKAQHIVLPTRNCIYCMVEKKSSEFNKEHVIPQLMGLYENGLTIKSVCKDCNTYFGRYIDPVFAEDTYEAILRLRTSIKSPDAIRAVRWDRINITVPPGTWWSGARLKLISNGDELVLALLPQLGLVRRSTGLYEYFTLSELEALTEWDDLNTGGFKLMAANTDHEYALKEFCSKKFGDSIVYREQGEKLPVISNEMDVDLETRIDSLVKRAVCKIAFNYLAKVIPNEFRELILDENFDDIRKFARMEQTLSADRIKVNIGNENSVLQMPDDVGIHAHILALEFRNNKLHCRFSPYDSLHYDVILANDIDKFMDPIGHLFAYNETPKQCIQLGIR